MITKLAWQIPVVVMVAVLYPNWWAVGAVFVANFLGWAEGWAAGRAAAIRGVVRRRA